MKIKNVILLVVAGITATFYSCDNRKDYFEDLNNAPNLTIRKTGTINVYSASIIDSFNLENLSYSCDYNVTDEKVESIKITSAYNVGSGTTQINLIDKKLIITPTSPGQQNITLTATDKFGKTSSSNITLTVFSNAPYLTIRKGGTINAYSTSIVDSFKLENLIYTCDYIYTDENAATVTMGANYNVGSGTNQIDLVNKKLNISPVTVGLQSISLTATDQFGNIGTCNITLTSFANLLPVANVNVTQTNANALYEVNIDAISSYDRDASFGGHIVEYEYKVGTTYQVNTPFSNINYIFPSAGNYNISVRVKDNNGGWSATKTINFTVQ